MNILAAGRSIINIATGESKDRAVFGQYPILAIFQDRGSLTSFSAAINARLTLVLPGFSHEG